jgi:hypothetical protein
MPAEEEAKFDPGRPHSLDLDLAQMRAPFTIAFQPLCARAGKVAFRVAAIGMQKAVVYVFCALVNVNTGNALRQSTVMLEELGSIAIAVETLA